MTAPRIPWYVPLLCLTAIPLVSEYLAPVLVLAALFTAVPTVRAAGCLRFGLCGKVLAVYLVYMLIGTLYSKHPLSTLSSVLLWVEALLVYLVVVNTVTTRVRLYRLLVWTAAVAGVVGLLAIIGHFLYRWGVCDDTVLRLWIPFERWLTEFLPLDIDLVYDHGRAAATFANPNLMCAYFSMVLPFVACGACYLPDRRHRLICRAAALPLLLGIVVSFSRGGYLAALLFVVFLALSGGFSGRTLLLGSAAVGALLPQDMLARLSSIGNMGDTAIASRLTAWQIAIEALPSRFFFGSGAGIMTSWSLLSANGSPDHHTHNLLLQLMLEGGIVALGLMVVLGMRMVQTGARMMLYQKADRRLGLALIGFFITFVVHGMFDWLLMLPKSVAIFAVALGLCDAITGVYMRRGSFVTLKRKREVST